MKKFLKNIILFLLPLVLIAIPMEFSLQNIPNDYNYKKQYLDENAHQIEKLFLGSSHTYYGINPNFISGNCFNASHISQTIDLDYRILRKYNNKWKKLEYIIIPIDYFTFFSRLSSGVEYWRLKNYNIYYKLQISRKLSENSELLSIDLKSNIYRIKSYYLSNVSEISCSDLGFGNNFKKQKDLQISGRKAALRHTNKDLSKLDESVKILQKIIELANKKKIKIILYTSPAYNTYIANLNKKQLDITINSTKLLAEKYNNCFYFNLLEDKSFISSDYRDADHLNPKGAKKLSKKIDSLINRLF